jgi:hypothetical protein
VLRLQLVGANPHAAVSGVDELPGRVNYVVGQDSTQWHTNIPTYTKVKYESVYPGVDLIYYGTDQRQLEYDFRVAPGSDPTSIRLKFEGVDTLKVDSAGDLVLRTAGGEIRQQRPFIYQEVAGVRQAVAGGYVRKGKREVAFHVSHYDASFPLIIDPVITYSTYLGGSGHESSPDADAGNDITLDTASNIGPDLVVSAFSAPTSGGAGTIITVTDTAKNQGGSGAGASTTKFYLSTNTSFGTGDVLLGSRAAPALAAGASHAASTSLTIPTGTARGSYFLLAVSDATQVVTEAKEGNNVKSRALTIP